MIDSFDDPEYVNWHSWQVLWRTTHQQGFTIPIYKLPRHISSQGIKSATSYPINYSSKNTQAFSHTYFNRSPTNARLSLASSSTLAYSSNSRHTYSFISCLLSTLSAQSLPWPAIASASSSLAKK